METNNKELIKAKLLSRSTKDGDCWIFTGYLNKDGYGSQAAFGKVWRVHRLSYFLYKGEIPQGQCVCHRCDKPACFNPDHLWIGSHLDNMNDMMRKKRTLYGEERPNNKISRSLRPIIVEKYLSGKSQIELAKEYNCHSSSIWNAIHHLIPVGKLGFVGEKHPKAKLTEKDVLEIRKLLTENANPKSLALKYNISIHSIYSIKRRVNWQHI